MSHGGKKLDAVVEASTRSGLREGTIQKKKNVSLQKKKKGVIPAVSRTGKRKKAL